MTTQAPASPVCPHLGRAHDEESYFAFPMEGNRCFRADPPQSPSLSHQSRFCLRSRHPECPAFAPGWSGPLPEVLAGGAARIRSRRARRRWLALLAVILVLGVAAAAWWYLGAGANSSAPSRPEAGAAAVGATVQRPTATPTRTPTRTPTPTPEPTATPQPTATSTQAPPRSPTTGPGLETPMGAAASFLVHETLAGENLSYLAELYGSTVEAIRAANGLDERPLWVGQLVVIPLGAVEVADLPQFAVYQVPEGGQALSDVAELYGADPDALRRYNNLGQDPALPSGRWLLIPLE